MHMTLYVIGKQKPGPCADLIGAYMRRMPGKVKVVQQEAKRLSDPGALKKAEAQLLLAEASADKYVVVLDERGENINNAAFAQLIAGQRTGNTKEIMFIIGGAHGLDASVRQRADFVLSFGQLVWPHQMVRLMLIEQIYRALMMNKGHPYHK